MIAKSPLARKFIITLVLLLFLFPFVSWYYLNQGLKWRKQAQELMQGAQKFPQGEWVDADENKFSNANVEHHVSIITILPCNSTSSTRELLDQLYDQFLESGKANFILIDSCLNDTWIDSTKQRWFVFDCSKTTGMCDSLLQKWPAGKQHALVDRNGTIRSYYASGSKEEKRVLLEHMALLLPRDRSDKVELKRGARK